MIEPSSKTINDAVVSSVRKRTVISRVNNEEAIPYKPGFLVRKGNYLFLFILALFVFISWLVRFPETVETNAKLTSINAPKPITCQVTGKLVRLMASENDQVKKNQVLGYLESTASHKEILMLGSDVDSIEVVLSRNEFIQLQKYFDRKYVKLGELQPFYQIFLQAFFNFRNYLSNGLYVKKRSILMDELQGLKEKKFTLTKQHDLQEQDIQLAQQTFEGNEKLNKNNVISDFDYRAEQSKLLIKKSSLLQLESNLVDNQNQQNEKLEQIMELQNAFNQQEATFHQALYTFKSQLEDWKKDYLLVAPVAGVVSFNSFVQENQQLQANQIICYVKPKNSTYFAEAIIPQYNFGKVKIGQIVNLRFSSYPSQEYGMVKGKIDFISQIPTDQGYLAKIDLTAGLRTTNGIPIQYREGLAANVEIIVREMRLFDRIYLEATGRIEN